MGKLNVKDKQGFTIIEVVLVLAIAALIFLMVFIALPALQRNQKDTARKTVVSKVTSAVTSYQSNNRGVNPTTAAQINGYIDGTSVLATATAPAYSMIDNEYGVTVQTYASLAAVPPASQGADAWNAVIGANNVQRIRIITGATCSTVAATANQAVAGASKQVAVLIGLENGNASLCQNL